ncbi:unnamed protein product [Prunus brigantina]
MAGAEGSPLVLQVRKLEGTLFFFFFLGLRHDGAEGGLPKIAFGREGATSRVPLPKGSCDVIASRKSPSKLRNGAFRREVVTSCLPKGSFDVIASCESPSKLRKGAFRREVVTSSRVARVPPSFRREVVTSSRGVRVLPSFEREPSEGKF